MENIENIQVKFQGKITATASFRGDETLVVRPKSWIEVVRYVKEELHFDMMMDLCGVHYPLRKDAFEVVVHLRRTNDGKRLRLKTMLDSAKPSVSSIAGVFKAANWFEREAFDLFGINFEGHPNLRRILCHQDFDGHPLRKDFQKDRRGDIPVPDTLLEEMDHGPWTMDHGPKTNGFERATSDERRATMLLNLGPSHPAMHGCFRVLLELDGEKIIKAVPEIGYLHRCFEKEAEAHPWHTIIPYTDRLNYCSPLMNNVGYCMAVEKLLGIEIPDRAKWIRMLVSEVSRICDHLVSIGANLVDIGALTNFWYLFNPREMFTDWIEALCGARLTTNYARIGGVARDVPIGTEIKLGECLTALESGIKDVEGLIKKNRIFIDRTRGVGAISKEDAISYGFTGPCLRAAGVDYDVRRAHPYYFYSELDWDIPIGASGDTYDRVFVRMEEMKQSAGMIRQILKKMSKGPVMAPRPEICLPAPHEVYGSIEGMIRQFKIVTEGISPPAGEIYSYTEAANGELGFYIVSDATNKPYRIKVRPPCFAIYQAYPELIKGHMIADAVAVLGSLNIIAGELDR